MKVLTAEETLSKYHCISCNEPLTNEEEMYCVNLKVEDPYCGHCLEWLMYKQEVDYDGGRDEN